MDGASTPPYAFGDLLAYARLSWLRETSARLRMLGFDNYRRGDGAVMRLVARGSVPLGKAGEVLGVTRQAARKIVGRLEADGYVGTARDGRDGRIVNVTATPAGLEYARALTSVTEALNRELANRVQGWQLEATDAVLRTSITDPQVAERAAHLVADPTGQRQSN